MTTFRITRGTVVQVAAPTVSVAPGLIPEDVTNPAELQDLLNSQLYRDAPLYAKDINRLISSISPTGKIVLQEDYEETAPTTLAWTMFNAGTLAYTNARAFRGQRSLLLTSQAVAGNTTYARRFFSRLPNESVGLEFWWRALDSDTREIRIPISIFTGTQLLTCEVRYDFSLNTWYVNTPTGLVNVGSFNFRAAQECWVHSKLIVDPAIPRFVSLECGPSIFDLSAYLGTTVDNGTNPTLQIAFGIVPDENVAKTIYVDDLIVTNEEP